MKILYHKLKKNLNLRGILGFFYYKKNQTYEYARQKIYKVLHFFYPKEEVDFIQHIVINKVGKIFLFLQKAIFLMGILLIFYEDFCGNLSGNLGGIEALAMNIEVEDEEVVIQGGNVVEQENGGTGGQSQQYENSEHVASQAPSAQQENSPTKSQKNSKRGGSIKKNEKGSSKESLKEEVISSQDNLETLSQNQLTENNPGGNKQSSVSENQSVSQNSGSYHNQITIHVKEDQTITNQHNSKKKSNKNSNEETIKQKKQEINEIETKKKKKAEGEGKALLMGFLGIYGVILLAVFLFFFKKGGTKTMKKLLQKVIGCVLLAFFLAIGSTFLGIGVQANNIDENNLFTFDWRTATDEELDHILGITDFEKTGYWLKSLSETELKEVLQKHTVLPKEMTLATYEVDEDGELVENSSGENLIYYEYCMSLATGKQKGQTFENSSGYYDYKFTMGSALSHYRMKISGLSTSKENDKPQTATLAVVAITQTHGNFVNFSSRAGKYNVTDGYSTKKLTNDFDGTGNYYILDAGFCFEKPLGYSVSLIKENAHNGYCNIYYYDEGLYETNQRKFVSDTNTKGNVFMALVARTNLYTNTTVGGTKSDTPEIPVCYRFDFTPVNYGIQYDGNGATGGTTANQSCTYGTTYYVQHNGFARDYTITYNGNGGTADKANEVVKYKFKGWGWFDTQKVTHTQGQSFSNLGCASDFVGRFYAIWDSASVVLPSASRIGYLFNGWANTDKAASGMAAKTTMTPTKNVTLYATWKPINYKIEFKDGYTEETKGEQVIAYGEKVTLNSTEDMGVKRPGYTFKGWKSSVGSYTDGQIVSNLTSENNGIITLTAEWQANNDTPYTVVHKVQNPSNMTQYIIRETERMTGTTDSVVMPDTKVYEGFRAPAKKSVIIAGDGSTEVIYLYAIQETKSLSYTVEHYLQDKSDKSKYNLDSKNTKIYYAKEGELVTPEIITTYKGYNIPSPQTITISATKKNVVKYYYTLMATSVNGTGNNAGVLGTDDSLNKGDINNFKPGEIKYYNDDKGNQYEIVVNQDGTLTIRSVKSAEKSSETLKLSGTLIINNTKYPVTEIAPYAFKNNKKITTITIGDGIKTIGKGAFEGCTKLKTVKFGVGLTVIGERAFYGCTSLQKVKTTRTLTTIGSKAFYNCKKLKSYTIGKYVTRIGSYAFYNCKKLKKVTLSESVEIVEKKAYYKCSSLKKVSIKTTNLIKVGSGAFKKCNKGLKFTVPAKKKKAYTKLLKGKS